MELLILGLVLFLGAHSVRIFAEGWRTRQVARLGPNGWKSLYSVLSLIGLVLIVWGYGQARLTPIALWIPSVGMRHLASLLTLASFILLAAAYVPRNAIKARIGHPMVVGVKVWALAHLLANHTLADVVLFGSFLIWAVLDFRAARARDRAAGTVRPAGGTLLGSAVAVCAGLIAWAVFAFWAHGAWIGVRPFG
jgi:uncharacterized membrane protein